MRRLLCEASFCHTASGTVSHVAQGVGPRFRNLRTKTGPGTAERLSQNMRTQPAPAEPGPDRLLELGTTVGPYVIVDRIGRGGMGQVFLGTDPRLQRRVALKCLLDSRAGADVRSRIIHEARAAARISSQHVAVVHDVIEHESRAFIVMEYVEGETLLARIRRGPLPTAETIAF